MTKIKFCGLSRRCDIEAVNELKPEYIGFVFVKTSKRYVSFEKAEELKSLLDPKIKAVGVFVNEDKDVITMYADRFGLEYIQLHGKESPEYCQSLRTSGLKIIKAFSVARPKDLNHVSEYEKTCNLFLFDTKCEQYGGSGNQFDWNILHTYNGQVPFLLSGGINSHSANALKAFNHPRLAGYDLNSRFELKPGEKDPERIRMFLNELKS